MRFIQRLLFKLAYSVGLRTLTRNKFVWYASYGSNSLRDRFHCYIQGGQYQGNSTNYSGCKDKFLPLDEKNVIIKHGLYFARESRSWNNGGVGFIRLDKNENEKTYGKMYLITKEQFSDIVKQETKRTQDIKIDFETAKKEGHLEILTNSWYGNLLYLNDEKGHPVFTFTNSENQTQFNRPTTDYLKTIINGITSNYDLNVSDIVVYLINKPGILNNYTEEELKQVINTVRVGAPIT